jgi:signal transduction histidine kinase
MLSAYLKKLSLKTRMALSVAALFILFVSVAVYLTLSFFERKLKEAIAVQQFSLVSSLANTIDDKLNIAQNALLAVAAKVPADTWLNAEKAQRFLDNRIGLKSNFDKGIFLIDKKGKLIAESPFKPDRRGKDLSHREFVQKTVASRKPYISNPFLSTYQPGQPAVNICVPVFDSRGELAGILAGGFALRGENSLTELAKTRIGIGGYLYISDSNRILIVHPDKDRIMKSGAQPGVNRLYDRAIRGYEGSGETVTSSGIRMISSCKHLRMTSWILMANYPASEAYAPLDRAKHYFFIATVIGLALLLFGTWLIMKRLMSPLAAITRHVELLPEKTGEERLAPITSMDEIGVLVTAFNVMVTTMDRQQEELYEQTEMLELEMAQRQKAQEVLAIKQQQLEALNSSLETSIAQAVDELRQKDQMLFQQNRLAAMGEMISNIAHQWRQPLNNVGLIIQNLMYSFEQGDLTEAEMRKEIDLAMDTIQFMSRTIDDFRDFTRNDRTEKGFQVNRVIGRTLDIISASLKNNGISVEIEAQEDVSAGGFPNEYSQVLLNILTNAKDVLLERNVTTPCIRIRIFKENNRSVVTIWDNGGGIAVDVLPRIFDPYFSTKGPGKGTGIGLYMSKMIIEKNMSGTLLARTVDGGAEFRMEIPSD